tara:strand:+ start:45 stop:821 length:777 start_codon:yes stop_codon:yes gene_type:complete
MKEEWVKKDITDLLQAWKFDPEANVRVIEGEDGVEKIQVRIDQGAFQGILQLDLDGRPDGRRPYGNAFALDHFHEILERYRHQHNADDEGFTLEPSDCKELFEEGARLYERYVFLLQLKDYERVIRDTERNMNLFRFVNRYAAQEEDRLNLEKWWPYILRINGTARAMIACAEEDYDRALAIVDETRERISACPTVEAEEFHAEMERSEEALSDLQREVEQLRPLSRMEQLQRLQEEAVAREDFERAALLRDELRKLQ